MSPPETDLKGRRASDSSSVDLGPGRDWGAEIDALLRADHGAPFALLGPHRNERLKSFDIRSFQPGAGRLWVIDSATGEIVTELARVHPAGFFSGSTGRAQPFAYRLRREDGGPVTEIDDPYRFPSLLGELDLHLLGEGKDLRIYDHLGAHPREIEGVAGVAFAVWAPNARRVSVVGSFNNWDGRCHPMRLRPEDGIWEIFIPGVAVGAIYKYEIKAATGELLPLKADPLARQTERPPRTG